MKKTSSKKLLSLALSFVLLLSIIASASISAAALSEAVDLGDSFETTISVPALGKVFAKVGADVKAADADDSDAQLWIFTKVGEANAYTIENKDGGYLAVQGDLTAALANVYVTVDNAQEYNIYEVNGKYVISPVGYANKAVDVNGVDFNVQYWDLNEANACQQYEFDIDVEDDTTTDDTTADDTTADDTTADDTTADDDTTEEGESSDVEDAVVEVNYAAGKKYSVKSNATDGAPVYCGSLVDTGKLLTDGILSGNAGFGQVEYQGSAAEHTITLNLGANRTDIDKVVFAGCRVNGNRQFARVTVQVSTNGSSYKTIAASEYEIKEVALEEADMFDFVFDFKEDVSAKYVRLVCANTQYVFDLSEIQVIGYGAEGDADTDVDAGDSENPGDAGYVVIALVAAISLAGAVIVSKRKFN